MREETRCRHIGYSFRLAARVLLYASSHRQDNTYHGLCYTSRGEEEEEENDNNDNEEYDDIDGYNDDDDGDDDEEEETYWFRIMLAKIKVAIVNV